MTKTILALTIASATILTLSMIANPVFAPGPPKVCDQVDDTNCIFSLVWDFDDTGADPGPPLVITIVNGGFAKSFGPTSTVPAEGSLEGSIVGAIKTISEDTQTNTIGDTTITTTFKTQSRNVNHIQGEIFIDGVAYTTNIKTPGYDSHQVEVTEKITTPTATQDTISKRLMIPITISLCTQDQSECFHGFGTINRGTVFITDGVNTITFDVYSLDAQLISQDGIFDLFLDYAQRTLS